ncbi:hypothetical protein [Nocardioides litoris]|uniref:hypothetical protein n=1 Tax=Nocardioides litoris TaxID=1926648 RepID=UPI00111DC0EB|nr:hypothetical protein [Nocardioides litoris]
MTARPTSRTRALTYANVTATLALAVALGGGGAAVAAGVAKNSVGSAQIKTGAVKTSDLAAGAVTSKKVKDGSVTGGDVKDGSLTGADVVESTLDLSGTRAGNVLSAVVEGNGTLVPGQSNGAVSASRVGAGVYNVLFGTDVSDCAYVASLGQPGGTGFPPSGDAGVTGLENKPAGLFVVAYNQAGATADRPFHVVVVC